MDRFTFTPTFSTGVSTDQKLLAAQFGDGYQQRAADGINSVRRRYVVRFNKVRTALAVDVVAFLEAHTGVTAFIWTPPAPNDTPRAWVIKPPWDHTHDAYDSESIQFELEQDFNPAAVCLAPSFSGTTTLTLTSATSGALIRYTSDGSTPKETHGTVYSGPFASVGGTTYKAIAYKTDKLPSTVTSHTA